MSRARWAANMTSSKRLGTCTMQSSTVTRAMATSDFPGAAGYTRLSKRQGRKCKPSAYGRYRCTALRMCSASRRSAGERLAGRRLDRRTCRRHRMAPVGRQVGQRPQHEGPARQPRMRQDGPAGPPAAISPRKSSRSRSIMRAALATRRTRPKACLDLVQRGQQPVGRQVGRHLGHGVDVPGLVGGRHRRRSIPGRDAGRSATPRRPSSASAASSVARGAP